MSFKGILSVLRQGTRCRHSIHNIKRPFSYAAAKTPFTSGGCNPRPLTLCKVFYSSSSCSTPQTQKTMSVSKGGESGVEGVAVNWDMNKFTPQEIEERAADLIQRVNSVYDALAKMPSDTVSYETVFKPLMELSRWEFTERMRLTFPRYVAVSKDIRDASTEATERLEKASIENSMRVDIFNKLVQYEEVAKKEQLSSEQRRALEKLVKEGRRNGLHLSEEVRSEVKALKNRLSELELQFSKHTNEADRTLLFSREELEGVSPLVLQGLEVDEASGKLKVTLKYPHFFPVTKDCRVPGTRKAMEVAYMSRCVTENIPILEEVLELRQKHAELLGYPNHAAYTQDVLMAKNPETVEKFLRDLWEKLLPHWEKEKAEMLQLKKEECEKYGLEWNGKLEPWDGRYYAQRIEERLFNVDHEHLKQYFPLEVVNQGMLDIYQTLLNLKFTKLPDAPVWHPDVSAYEVRDVESGEVLGFFYLDLFPREGKYGHACCVPLQLSCFYGEGEGRKRQPTAIAMVCNFTQPQKDTPSLLEHKEVETYFHEFGHAMHSICSMTETTMFSGAVAVERDFVECPSQMLENWVWDKTPLNIMSRHYKTGEALPVEMVERLVGSQKANTGGANLRQVVLALFDQRIHKGGRCDVTAKYAETLMEVMGLDMIPGTSMPATFNHIICGYSAQYYSYLWAEVYCMDMFHTKFGPEKLMSAEVGQLYREKILQPGGSVDAVEMLREFLGRDPEPEPFLRSKGLL